MSPKIIEERIVDFIKNIVSDSGSNGVVLGLSGGIDSALCAFLCSKAVGPKNVTGIFFYESQNGILEENEEYGDALLISENSEIQFMTVDMTPMIKGLDETIRTLRQENKKENENGIYLTNLKKTTAEQNHIHSGNIKARIRMALLYNIANRTQSLVCGTQNKSEYMLGYFTKYGDGGVDFEPLADLYKTEVWDLARHMGVPEKIILKKPSAGFSSEQTDEKELGITYEKLDPVLKLWEKEKDVNILIQKTNCSPHTICDILKRIRDANHKRNTPPICAVKNIKN